MNNKALIPSIRFKYFIDPWKRGTLGNFLQDPKLEKVDVKDSRQLLTLGLNLTGLRLGGNKNKLSFGSTAYYRRYAGQLIYGKQNFFHGSIAIIPDEYDGRCTSGDVPTLDIVGVNPYYLYFYIARPEYYEPKENDAIGTGSKRIHQDVLKSFEFSYPTSSDEQVMIANFFKLINNLITLYQRKYNVLINIKNSLLFKMFPEKNKDIPVIRFNGFTDAWEKRILSDLIIDGGSGGTPLTSNKDFYNGSIPFLSITDITNSDGFIYDTEKHITEEGLMSSAAWIVPAESVSLAMYASVGKVAILKKDIATSQAFYNLVFDNLNMRNIVYQTLKKKEAYGEWIPITSTGTQANLNAQKVKEATIKIPLNESEQNMINSLLFSLDTLIVLHQHKYKKLQNIKKSLLNSMFVK